MGHSRHRFTTIGECAVSRSDWLGSGCDRRRAHGFSGRVGLTVDPGLSETRIGSRALFAGPALIGEAVIALSEDEMVEEHDPQQLSAFS